MAMIARSGSVGLHRTSNRSKFAVMDAVLKYLASKFKDALQPVSEAMSVLAASWDLEDLAAQAYSLHEQFRPDIPAGEAGWGAVGVLSLKGIQLPAKRA